MRSIIEKHFDSISKSYNAGKIKYSLYYDALKALLSENIKGGVRVAEIGCGTGQLLATVNPKYGYGMDISNGMIKKAKTSYNGYKNLKFSTKWPIGKFDYIFMCDVIEHLVEPKIEFQKIVSLMNQKSKFINTMANPIWEPLLILWEKLGLKMKEGPHKRIGYKEIVSICQKSGLKIIKHHYTLLIPIYIPFVTNFANKYIAKYLKELCFIEYFIAVKV